MDKKQTSINSSTLETAKKHPLYVAGRGEGQGVTGLVNMALEWALSKGNEEALTQYSNGFELRRIERQIKDLQAQKKSLQPANTKKGKK